MSFTLVQLEAQFRRDLQDELQPYLWSQATLYELLDTAQEEFTREVDVLYDELSIQYSADDETVDVPLYVTRVRSGQAPSEKPLKLYNWEEWTGEAIVDDDYGELAPSTSWRTAEGVEPKYLLTDIETGKARMYPIPNADGTLRLQVYRTQITRVTDSEELEVTDHVFQGLILKKAEAEAFSVFGMESYDPRRAAELMTLYELGVSKAKSRVKRRSRRARLTQYGGY